jgi:hypothetical protein
MSTLPPKDRAALIRETVRLVAGCIAFIVLLGVLVYFMTP